MYSDTGNKTIKSKYKSFFNLEEVVELSIIILIRREDQLQNQLRSDEKDRSTYGPKEKKQK
jgi:hypothetical protein